MSTSNRCISSEATAACRHTVIKNVGKSESCMVYQLRIILQRTRKCIWSELLSHLFLSTSTVSLTLRWFCCSFRTSSGDTTGLWTTCSSPRRRAARWHRTASSILSTLGCDFQISKASHPGNWSKREGSLKVNADFSKTQLIHKLGSGLKKLRQTN